MRSAKDSKYPAIALRRFVSTGVVGGVVGGLLGGGSGVVFVPVLDRLLDAPRPVVHGTAGAANIAVTGLGAAAFAMFGGSIDSRAAPGLVLGSISGAVLGARLIRKAPDRLLRWLFVLVLAATLIKLMGPLVAGLSLKGATAGFLGQANFWVTTSITVGLGFVIGAWAAGMGLGGGLLAVPTLLTVFGADLPTAEGTSLLMFFPNTVVATWVHARQGTADLAVGWRLNIGAAPGAVVGAAMAVSISSRALSVLFAAFVVAVLLRELRSLIARR